MKSYTEYVLHKNKEKRRRKGEVETDKTNELSYKAIVKHSARKTKNLNSKQHKTKSTHY